MNLFAISKALSPFIADDLGLFVAAAQLVCRSSVAETGRSSAALADIALPLDPSSGFGRGWLSTFGGET